MLNRMRGAEKLEELLAMNALLDRLREPEVQRQQAELLLAFARKVYPDVSPPLAEAMIALRLCHDAAAIAELRAAAEITVAAHEAGHSIQHLVGYAPLNFRSAMVPVTNIGARLWM
ncbi:MAG: zinc metallopeptidase, partial [Myxococcales bacterium]|nr:zinc metallopeptidase [Myxococcales bacterium]